MPSKLRRSIRAVLVGFASLFSFGDPDRHFAEPPQILHPVAEEVDASDRGEPGPEDA